MDFSGRDTKPLLAKQPAAPAFDLDRYLHYRKAYRAASELTAAQVALIAVCVLMVIGGNAGQLIALNIWLTNFNGIQSPFTVLILSATTIATGFGVALGVRIFLVRPSLRFLLSMRCGALSLAIGMCNSLNGVLLVFASAPNTPEVLQALLLSTQIFWTLLFVKVTFKETRNSLTFAVVLAFLLSAGGIILGFSPQFAGSTMDYDQKWWTFIFAASMVPGALYNVFASLFMRSFTTPREAGDAKRVDISGSGENGKLLNASHKTRTVVVGDGTTSDDTTVKLAMLTITGFSQVFWMFVFFPLDSAPWFGTTDSLAASRSNLAQGFQCVFLTSVCQYTFAYYVAFNASYMLNYLGSAYLNHYSATLNSMVTQLSSPVSALVLIVIPSWNVTDQPESVSVSIGAIVMLIVGSLVYASWEQGTRDAQPPREGGAEEDDNTVPHPFV